MDSWIKPEFIEISVNSECTAYSDVDDSVI
jgi:coenzyme PQQ precursor peptide PqqA